MTGAETEPERRFVHRLGPGYKLAALFLFSILLFCINRLDITVAAVLATVLLYKLAGFPVKRAWQQIRPLWWLFIILFVFQLFVSQWENSLVVVLRLAALLLFAGLVTLTTPASRMMETLESGFRILKPFGVQPAKISLALSLTLRFIPVLGQIAHDVREAQKARRLENSFVAMIIPVTIRTLKMTDDVATAIEARCYDSET